MLNKSLTIVLPVYNAESRLRKSVSELLELASELTDKFGVLIVDDGSTDTTFEVAEELASHYPQVSVRRHRQRSGLGATIEYVQRRVRTDAVLLHDGVTPMDAQQMRSEWRRWIDQAQVKNGDAPQRAIANDAFDFGNLSALQSAMERAHKQVIGFQLITPKRYDGVFADDAVIDAALGKRSTAAHDPHGSGVGRIPTLPRPKFLTALADFAFGE